MALSRAGSSPAFGTIGAREASLGGAAIRAAAPELSLIACARSHLGGAAIRAAAPGQDAGSGHPGVELPACGWFNYCNCKLSMNYSPPPPPPLGNSPAMLLSRRKIIQVLSVMGRHYCPLCEKRVWFFLPYSTPSNVAYRKNARCPHCGSLERHRLDWVFMARHTNLLDGSDKKVLHVGPDGNLSARLRSIENLDYLSAGLAAPHAMVEMDITDIDYPEHYFSVIHCSHVLEHVVDDRKALAELYRVLCEGGFAILNVPIMAEKTYEDPSITTIEERRKHFGDGSHVRICGFDYAERIRSAGFSVRAVQASEVATEAECTRMGLWFLDVLSRHRSASVPLLIYFCEKTGKNGAR